MRTYHFAILLGILLFLASTSHGQVYLGGKAGVSLSSLFVQENRNDIFNPAINDEIKLGFVGGVMVQFFAQPHTGIQAELNLVQKGWTELLDTVNTFSTTLNYLELPVMTHLYVGKGKTRWHFLVGPSIGYLLSYSESDFDPELEDRITYRMTEENRKNFTVGIQGGTGLNRRFKFGHLQFDFIYSLSFSNIFRNPGDPNVPDRSLPSYVGLSLAWMKEVSQ